MSEIKGLSDKKILAIKKATLKLVLANKVYTKLQTYFSSKKEFSITREKCLELVMLYEKETMNVILENPYTLIKDIQLSFEEVDCLARKMGVLEDSICRVQAVVKYIHTEFCNFGHTGMSYFDFSEKMKKYFSYEVKNSVNEVFKGLLQRGSYEYVSNNDGTGILYNGFLIRQERVIAEEVQRLLKFQVKEIPDLFEQIDKLEKESGILLEVEQRNAISTALTQPITVITGGPGSGKSMITRFICQIYESYSGHVPILLAPTGKAAHRLAECTGLKATTIHSKLKMYSFDDDEKDNEATVEDIMNTLVIVDEVSMVDVKIAAALLKKIKGTAQLVLLGDIEQLPSIGNGAFLRDLIGSNIVNVVKLTKSFRSTKSSIFENVQKIQNGYTDLVEDENFAIHYESDLEKCKEIITSLYRQRVEEYGIENVMLLVPYRHSIAGVEDMNRHLQKIINPPEKNKHEVKVGETIYRVGDVVMHVRSNTPDASNGDTGIITEALDIEGTIQVHVNMNGKLLVYDRTGLNFLDLAYAMSVHKSQGSESAAVIFLMTMHHKYMHYRNIPYVAVSRGKRVVDVVGDKSFFEAIKIVKANERITKLADFLTESNKSPSSSAVSTKWG